MSLGYADRLTQIENVGGELGKPEIEDTQRQITRNIARLVEWVRGVGKAITPSNTPASPLLLPHQAQIRASKHIVIFTGAGISTPCGLPDFRGPNGIWTLRKKGLPLPPLNTPFFAAKPSYTHAAIATLAQRGIVRFVVSQNVDGLHVRSGLPLDRLAELHGNCFVERCMRCGRRYLRDFEMDTVGFQPTGRTCVGCVDGGKKEGGATPTIMPTLAPISIPTSMPTSTHEDTDTTNAPPPMSDTTNAPPPLLVDHVLDWDDALPDEDLDAAEEHCAAADMVCSLYAGAVLLCIE